MSVIKWLWRLLLMAITLMGLLAGGLYYGITQPLMIDEPIIYEVKPGYTATRIGSQMEARGWIYNALLMRVAARLNPHWVSKVGEYEITPQMNILDLLAKLDSGDAIHYKVTLLEGNTTQEFLDTLAQKGNVDMTLSGLSNIELSRKLNLPYPNAEGLFFADTYQYYKGDTDEAILRRAHRKLMAELERLWASKDKFTPLASAYEALILASIIEKETGDASERPIISKVFVNRLKRNIRLQTDPTVIYGLGSDFDGNLTRAHLRKKTPYNTYTIFGLPPTPIANVGKESIEAAAKPGETDALYFVAKGDGTHVFSRTLREHNNAVAKYQRYQRRADYTSSPQ
ncbi:endolytic transglycosylase MltG [Marinomonas algicola]|uniref:endolytic transglycosylase MltG n=1 Tax=Marinomonas algicola TaxID=2773454 RepID=UPI00174AD75A|nr:endolytic transglycosylase MltG [Marinomonas algicola]